jgi:hypothetical protein
MSETEVPDVDKKFNPREEVRVRVELRLGLGLGSGIRLSMRLKPLMLLRSLTLGKR